MTAETLDTGGHIYVIDVNKCNDCGACARQCPVDAIVKFNTKAININDMANNELEASGNPKKSPLPNTLRILAGIELFGVIIFILFYICLGWEVGLDIDEWVLVLCWILSIYHFCFMFGFAKIIEAADKYVKQR